MKNWEEIYQTKGDVLKGTLKKISEVVPLFKKKKTKKILDLGCSTGRNSLFLVEQGFSVYSVDNSETAIKMLNQKIKSKNQKNVMTSIQDMRSLSFKNNFFDAVICTGVLQHAILEDQKKTIKEIKRVLRKNGLLITDLMSTKDPDFKAGKEIEKNTFIGLEEEEETPHHCSDRKEARELFSGFGIIKFYHKTKPIGYKTRKNMEAKWHIVAVNPQSNQEKRKIKLDFAKMNGLLPVVIQDYQNDEVLMLGFMDERAWELTRETGKVHYWSRKKKRLWMKGEESKNYQYVKEIYIDNDNDTLLIKVKQIGGAVEDGYRSCFDKMINGEKIIEVGKKVFDPKKAYKNYSETIVFAIPSGSLYSATIMLLGLAGFQLELRGKRSYKPSIRNNTKIKLVIARAQEIPRIIESGRADIGLTGIDLVKEDDVSVTDLVDLEYNEGGIGKVFWVLAVPKNEKNKYKNLKAFEGKKIATELPNITKEYFEKNDISVKIEKSIGATESKAPFFADAIVDLTETGKTLKDNGLIPLYKIRESTTHLIAHNHSMAYGWKRRKIEEITEKLKRASKKLSKSPKKLIKLPR